MPGIRTWAAACVAVGVVAVGCSSKSNYACTGSEQCQLAGVQGVCEAQGFCSFPDSQCASGRKFDSTAGGGLAGQCVTPGGDGGMGSDGGMQASCIEQVVPGRHAMCVLKTDHTVWCAGQDDVGQLGIGLAGNQQTTWNQVKDASGAPVTDATALSLGWEFACAVRAGGSVWCWGGGGDGQIGNNMQSSESSPTQVMLANGQPLMGIVEIGSGYAHNCARDGNGSVWCWGLNDQGQVGDGTATTPRKVATPVLSAPGGAAFAGALSLAVGGHHACVMTANNQVWCWGKNSAGELGDGSTTNRTTPVMIANATAYAVGHNNICTVHAADSSTYCSGQVWRNRIGNGAPAYDTTPGNYSMPQKVLTAPGGSALTGVTSLAVGGAACALVGGAAMCWGDDVHGQTGTGGGAATPAPVIAVGGKPLTGVDRIVTKFANVCAHQTSGAWLCWGRGLEGAYGDGSLQNRGLATPLKVTCP